MNADQEREPTQAPTHPKKRRKPKIASEVWQPQPVAQPEPVNCAKPDQKTHRSYAEKLRDPRWQKVRLEVMNKARFCCQMCGDHEATLNIHHVNYTKGKEPWDYESENFRCYCEDCHKEIEESIKEFRELCCGCTLPMTIQKVTRRIKGAIYKLGPYPSESDVLRVAAKDAEFSSSGSELLMILNSAGFEPNPETRKQLREFLLNLLDRT